MDAVKRQGIAVQNVRLKYLFDSLFLCFFIYMSYSFFLFFSFFSFFLDRFGTTRSTTTVAPLSTSSSDSSSTNSLLASIPPLQGTELEYPEFPSACFHKNIFLILLYKILFYIHVNLTYIYNSSHVSWNSFFFLHFF
mgnify:CR=1 FL=1